MFNKVRREDRSILGYSDVPRVTSALHLGRNDNAAGTAAAFANVSKAGETGPHRAGGGQGGNGEA